MRRAAGELVLSDPFFADGPNLYGSILTDPMVVARLIPAARRRHMLELPLAESGPWDPVEREKMRAALASADAELRAREISRVRSVKPRTLVVLSAVAPRRWHRPGGPAAASYAGSSSSHTTGR